jgi:hypothetical protein
MRLSIVDTFAIQLAKTGPADLTHWTWRDREGQRHTPASLETHHLFYTLRMIWNHVVPSHMRVGKVRLYIFSAKHYSPRYFAEAVAALGAELMTRQDVTPEWEVELAQMAEWLRNRPGSIVVSGVKELVGQ